MSDPVRVALVAEGPTDAIVIEAALKATFGNTAFVLTQLQPEGSLAFGSLGAGWAGVYRWCKQAVARGAGRLAHDELLFGMHDFLIIHVDADVAGESYAAGSITPDAHDLALPCSLPCPPARDTTDAMRRVVLSWCGETAEPLKTVLCVPSKSIEAWVVVALFPSDIALGGPAPFECYAKPEARLGQQRKARRVHKTTAEYRAKSSSLRSAWSSVAALLDEAHRFESDLHAIQATL